MILLDKVSFGYDRGETLSDLSAEIAPGSFNFLTGPSGAGKSTLMKLLYLRHRPSRGVFELFGEQPSALGPDEVAGLRRRIGIIFQEARLLDHLSVLDNIALPLVAAVRLIGAEDRFISTAFVRRVARRAALGGLLGGALGCGALALLPSVPGEAWLGLDLRPQRLGWAALGLGVPLAGTLVAWLAARTTVRLALRRLP